MAKEATELELAPIKAMLQQLEMEVIETVGAKTGMGLKISEMESQLAMVTDRVGDALFQRLVDVENAQERLMHVVEGINVERGVSQNEEREDEEETSPRSDEQGSNKRPLSIGEGSTWQSAIDGVPDSVTS